MPGAVVRGLLTMLTILTVIALAEQLTLIKIWSYKTGGEIRALSFNDGYLAAASGDHCGYIFALNGSLTNAVCGNDMMTGVSSYNNTFGFLNLNGNVYVTYKNGTLIKKIYVGYYYAMAIAMEKDGFVSCAIRCAYFTLNGSKLWDLDVEQVAKRPAYYRGFWYIPDWYSQKVLIVDNSTGTVMNSLNYSDRPMSVDVCNDYLAVATDNYLYLYNLNVPIVPRELWKAELIGGYDVAFSPDCKYIAVADYHMLKIYDIEGNLLLREFPGFFVRSVAWWGSEVAVGLADGNIYVYGLTNVTSLPTSLESATTTTSSTTYKGVEQLPVGALTLLVLLSRRLLSKLKYLHVLLERGYHGQARKVLYKETC